ncbi:MAG: hypothetical protein IPO66_15730 [Rhodanobacteraceae bacterium]|nr:hypothetical protein [Rhodanobacteraceae bacterium]
MIWSATGTLLVFCFWHTLLFAFVTLLPLGAVALQPRAIGVAGLDARWTLGLEGPDALFIALAWAVVGLLAIPWALLVRRVGRVDEARAIARVRLTRGTARARPRTRAVLRDPGSRSSLHSLRIHPAHSRRRHAHPTRARQHPPQRNVRKI